jgi:hypothetical protein
MPANSISSSSSLQPGFNSSALTCSSSVRRIQTRRGAGARLPRPRRHVGGPLGHAAHMSVLAPLSSEPAPALTPKPDMLASHPAQSSTPERPTAGQPRLRAERAHPLFLSPHRQECCLTTLVANQHSPSRVKPDSAGARSTRLGGLDGGWLDLARRARYDPHQTLPGHRSTAPR